MTDPLRHPARVVIRADAGPQQGSGHVMRGSALTEALRARGAEVHFVSTGLRGRVRADLDELGATTEEVPACWPDERDLAATVATARSGDAAVRWVVVDGYHFDRRYMQGLVDAGLRVAWIDDLRSCGVYVSDLVVNPTLGAERVSYDGSPGTRVLTGATYALVRSVFSRRADGQDRSSGPIVITLGGADPVGLTVPVMEQVAGGPAHGHRVVVVVGPSNPRLEAIRAAAAATPGVEVLADPSDWPTVLASATLVVAAAGGVTWEAACLGVPSVLLVAADNQQRGAAAMLEACAAVVVRIGDGDGKVGDLSSRVGALMADPTTRQCMGAMARRLVDGVGAARVARWMLDGPQPAAATIRPVTRDDALQVWRINSDPSTRAQSFDPSPIPLAQHFGWFDRYLESASGRMYACMREDEMAGVIRFDRSGPDVAELSFAVAPPFRGFGLGTRLLADSWQTACADLNVSTIRGMVIDDNRASLAAFARAGFVEVRRGTFRERSCVVFERSVT